MQIHFVLSFKEVLRMLSILCILLAVGQLYYAIWGAHPVHYYTYAEPVYESAKWYQSAAVTGFLSFIFFLVFLSCDAPLEVE